MAFRTMIRATACAVFSSVALAACAQTPAEVTAPTAASSGGRLGASSTVFSAGVHPPSGSPQPGQDFETTVLHRLGVSYSRTQVSTVNDSGKPQTAAYQAMTGAGFKVLLNIYDKDTTSTGVANKAGKVKPVAGPPADLTTYGTQVGQLLDAYQPAFVVIENEENGRYYSGTPPQYIAELQAGTKAAHARGYQVANGGITGVPVSLAVWKDYWDRGLKTEAADFARRAFAPGTKAAAIYDQLPTEADPNKPFPPTAGSVGDRYAWTVAELASLKSTDIDYVNVHWYQDDAKAFGEVADYLQRVTGKPVISNEVGSATTDPQDVTALLQQAVDHHMAYLNWFSGDITTTTDNVDEQQVRALQNPDGSLRPTGAAFAAFVAAQHR